MTDHTSYISHQWGDLQAFLDFYVPLDQRIRNQLTNTGTEAIVDNIVAAASTTLAKGLTETNNKLSDLRTLMHNVAGQISPDTLCELMQPVLLSGLEQKMRDLTVSNREELMSNLVHYLRVTDNDRLQEKLDRINNTCQLSSCELTTFRTNIKDVMSELQESSRGVASLSEPVTQILQQVMLHKSGKASIIGHDAEQRFHMLLTECFPEHSADAVSGTAHKGDFTLAKESLPDVLLELKSWEVNVKTRDVLKFERDVQNNCKHGILISMRSGVVNRRDFEFKVIDNRYIALYLCNVNWDMTRVKAAVSLIYSLEDMLRVADRDGNVAFPDDVIQSLNKDVQDYDTRLKDSIAQLDKARNILTSIMLDSIKTRLATGIRAVSPPQVANKVVEGQCSFCRQIRSSWQDKSNLNAHVKTCTARLLQDKQREYDAKSKDSVETTTTI